MGISEQGLFKPCSVRGVIGNVNLCRHPARRGAVAKIVADSTLARTGVFVFGPLPVLRVPRRWVWLALEAQPSRVGLPAEPVRHLKSLSGSHRLRRGEAL